MLGRLRELRRDLGLMEIVVGLALGYALADLAGALSATIIDFWRYEPFEGDGGTGLALENLFSEGFSLRIGERFLDLSRIFAAVLQALLILGVALLLWRKDEETVP